MLVLNFYNIVDVVVELDLVIGVVLILGVKVLKLVIEEMVKIMKLGFVIVDVVID